MTQDEVIVSMSKELCDVLGKGNTLTKGEIIRLNRGCTIMPLDMIVAGVLRKSAAGYRVSDTAMRHKLIDRSNKND